MRIVSDDRVMRAAEGLMDARSRVRDAWKVLTNGYELPNVDPALDENVGGRINARGASDETRAPARTNGHATNGSNGSNGSNGAAAVQGSTDMDESMKERNSLAAIGG
jgi:hypothetical protein